jgi:pyridoxine/pyridoxamine 5'-phosphate oxidase
MAGTVPFSEPFTRFRPILAEAEATGMPNPKGMSVATVDAFHARR